MIGFEIKFRGERIDIAPEFSVGAFVFQKNGSFHADVSGLEEKSDGKMISYKWIDSDMELGESLEIEIKNIDNPSEPIKKKEAFSDTVIPVTKQDIEEMLAEKLNYFYTLGKLLKNEGLI